MKLRPTIIEVTRKMVRETKRTNSMHCMVAFAGQAAGLDNVSVRYTKMRFTVRGELHEIKLPHWLGQRIRRFDNGADVRPFRFRVESDGSITKLDGKPKETVQDSIPEILFPDF